MPFDRFLIAPIMTGKQTDLRPWLIPDDAFTELNNAYIFRGRVRKRFGEVLTGNGAPNATIAPFYSRLAIKLGTTDGAGNFVGTAPSAVLKIGQAFTIGNEIFTVYQTGAPAVMLDTGTATVKTYNNFNGVVVINGATALTDVYYYPANPVMGLTLYDKAGVTVNDQPAYAFDTQFAYTFDSTVGFWVRSGTAVWHGTNANFFWATNWRGGLPSDRVLFVSNFFVVNPNGAGNAFDDPIWWTIDGINWIAGTGVNAFYFAPNGGAIHTGPFVETSRIIIGFKNRLVLLNTIENDNSGGLGINTQYVNRARFSKEGSPFSENAWYEPNQTDNSGSDESRWAGAGFEDAPTDEAIISAEFIKDRLIVYFERSTWELAYTRNDAVPFIWQKINTELGSEATFSTVPFDRHILTMSNTGVHACNGSNVERIDTKIPDEIFEIRNKNEGVQRVAGIRDYFTELVYWTFPSINQPTVQPTFPNRILVYNYRTGSWALNDDTITVFGYFNQQVDQTWQQLNTTTWEESTFSWDSATEQAQFRQVIAGNQEGYVFIIDSDYARNAPVMQITNITNGVLGFIILTIIDHNLVVGDYIAIENALNSPTTTGLPSPLIVRVIRVVDKDTVQAASDLIPITQFAGTYVGGGSATRVSDINFMTKEFNPYVDKGRNVYVARIDFGLLRTQAGEITVDYLTSSSELSMIQAAQATQMIMGTSVLETSAYVTIPLEASQERIWHPIYFQSEGEFIQLSFYLNPFEISTPAIAWDDFQLEGMVLHTQPTSQRLQ